MAELRDTTASGRAIRVGDVLIGFDPDDTLTADAAKRTDTLSEVIATTFENPPASLTAAQSEAIRDLLQIWETLRSSIVAGSNITLDVDNNANTITISSTGGGGGGSDDGVITGATLNASTRVVTITRSVGADLQLDLSALALQSGLNTKADLDDPDFTSTPTVPTAPAGNSSTQIANTRFVRTEIDAIPAPTDTNDFVDNVDLDLSGNDLTLTVGRTGSLGDLSDTVTLPSGGGTDTNDFVDVVDLEVSGSDLTLTLGRTGSLSDLSDTVTLPSGTDTNDYVDDVDLTLSGSDLTLTVGRTGTLADLSDTITLPSGTTLSEEQIQDVIGAMVDGNTETGIAVTYDDATGKLNFAVADTTPSAHTRYAAVSADDTFTAAEFLAGTNSQTNTITIPSYTQNRYLAFAIPDAQPDLTDIREQGSALNSFGAFERVSGTIDISGSAHKVWRSSEVFFPPEPGETLIWEIS